MISAKVIADSRNEFGNRLTSMVVTFPRIILAEAKTHRIVSGLEEQVTVIEEALGFNDERDFSRNSASSRAIPFAKMVESVQKNPFIPIAWQKDHKGMQGTEYFTDQADIEELVKEHLEARDRMVIAAYKQATKGLTKQICNRYLEPFMWHTVIVTATEWENFFSLRCPQYKVAGSVNKVYRSWKDVTQDYLHLEQDASILTKLSYNQGQAEIHMMALAEAMWDALNESTPKELKAGEWHIPFGDNIPPEKLTPAIHNGLLNDGTVESRTDSFQIVNIARVKIATARCARVSYTVMGEEGKPDNYENDIKLHDRLAASGHWSPFEHCARVPIAPELEETGWSGNFRGFIQYRKMFANENITK